MSNGDLISRQAAINALENTECELLPEEWDELTDAIVSVPSVQTSRIEKILHGKSPKEQFKIIERIFATGKYWTDSRQAIIDWFDGKEMPLFDYYVDRHD